MIDLRAFINEAAGTFGVRASLIAAQIQHESGGNIYAVGDGGQAKGCMQMHPAAAAEVGGKWETLLPTGPDDEMRAARAQILLGTSYLLKMLKLFGGDEEWALAAYNQGETVISRARHYADAVLALEQQ